MPTLKATLFLLLVLLPLIDARLLQETDENSPDGDKLSLDMQEKREDEAKTEDLDSEKKDTESTEDSLVQRKLKSISHKRQDDMAGIGGRSIESKDENEMHPQLVKLNELEENEERRDEGAVPQPPGLWGREFENGPPGLWGREFENKLHTRVGEWEREIEKRQPPGLWGREIENGPPGLWGREFENKVPKPAGAWEREIENRRPPGLWGREIKNGPPGLWGREFENKVPNPSGAWEREIENRQPPGLWGREIDE